MFEDVPHWIDGAAVESGDSFANIDPWTQESHGRVAQGSQREVDDAVASARRAFDEGDWPKMGYAARSALLHDLADAIDDNASLLGEADTRDMGKPRSVTTGNDVPRAAQNFRFFADLARLSADERYPSDTGHHTFSSHQPAGVVAAISPWNFPLMLGSWKIAPALAWGNTVVLKPAESSPTSATEVARLATEVGFPPGVLNVINGYGHDAGAALTKSTLIDRITFTGGSLTGKAIMREAADTLTPVSLELGGKGATIVFEDADLDEAVEWAARAIFSNSGQICLCGSRIYVARSIHDRFIEQFVAIAERYVVGDPMDSATDLGPLASPEHHAKVSSYLTDRNADEGEIVTGGLIPDTLAVRPTVIVGAQQDSRVCREEIFGPLAPVLPFDTEAEAVALANDTRFGLSAMVFTEDLHRAHRVAGELNAGSVWVNCFYVRNLRAPFGGFGDSGIGREGGLYSREFFTEPKTTTMQIKR